MQEPKTTSTKKRRVLPFHPILFALFPLLVLLAHNFNQIPFRQAVRPFILAPLFTVVVWAFFQLLTRQIRKAAVATAIIVLFFFTYGHLVSMTPHTLRVLVFPVSILLVVGMIAILIRTRQPLYDATVVLNWTSLFLVAPSLWTIAVGVKTAGQAASGPPVQTTPRRHPMAAESANLPDIYYIILDAYGRDDRFRQLYAFDNTPFLKELEKRGFYIARKSGANYDQTPLCLSSSLNMNYLDPVHHTYSPEMLRQMVDDSTVAQYLENKGYHYVNIWSGLEVSRVTTADLVLNNEVSLSHFERQALRVTAIGITTRLQHNLYDRSRNRIRGVFADLDTVAQLPYPKFVFAHALAPHPPFIFGARGEPVYPGWPIDDADGSWLVGKDMTRRQYIQEYTAQMQYINTRVLQAVDAILKQSRRPPIIILQGDHGSRMTLNWESQAKTDLREPFSIFNAYYVPKKVRSALYDTITPVNSFRVVLNQLFDEHYPILPDRSYYSTFSHPYNFTDVTALIPLAKGPADSDTTPGTSGQMDDGSER